MHNNNTDREKFEKAVEGRLLLKRIRRLYSLTDPQEAGRLQKRMEALNLRYSVLSREGRLELMEALVAAGGKNLNAFEKRTLVRLAQAISREKDAEETPLNLCIDYLNQTINACCGKTFGEASRGAFLSAISAEGRFAKGNLLFALWLTGVVLSGCDDRNVFTPAERFVAETPLRVAAVTTGPRPAEASSADQGLRADPAGDMLTTYTVII